MGLDILFIKCGKNATTKQKQTTKPILHLKNFEPIDVWLISHGAYTITDDGFMPIEKHTLERLIADCQAVCNNANTAEKTLPIARDGNCDNYGGGYFKSLCFATINLFEILNQTDFKTENIYYKTENT